MRFVRVDLLLELRQRPPRVLRSARPSHRQVQQLLHRRTARRGLVRRLATLQGGRGV